MSELFRILKPFQVSDVALVSSTVSATDADATQGTYNPATAYAIGDVVQVDSPTFTFTASSTKLTAVAHGFVDGQRAQLSTTGTLPAGLVTGISYYIVQAATDRLGLSTTLNGPPIATTDAGTGTHTSTVSTHLLYESLTAGNTGNTPHKSSTHWLDLGATNRWKPFDVSVGSQVLSVGAMTYVLQTTGRISGLALLNVNAESVTITGRESGGGAIVYGPTTYPLRKSVSEVSYWSWFFEPIEYSNNFVDIDFPPINNTELTITLNPIGGVTRCGVIIAGLAKTFGTSLAGASIGITDYSVKTQDDFGNYTVLERAFRQTGTFSIVVDNASVDGVQAELTKYRATPVVYVGSTSFSSTILYGFYKGFTNNIAYPAYTICDIEIEGIT